MGVRPVTTAGRNAVFANDVWRKLAAHASRLTLAVNVHSFVLAIVQWPVINSLSDEIASEDALVSSGVPVDAEPQRTTALNFRKHPLLLQFFPENVNDVDVKSSIFDIYSILANQITEIFLRLLTTFLWAYVASNRLPSTAQLLISCLERQSRPKFDGAVSAEAQRAFAAVILSLLQGFADNSTDSEFEEVVKNAFGASYYWMDDSTCASTLLDALAVYDKMGWPARNSDMWSYIQNLRTRCIAIGLV
ncbi:hypothetical protein FB451DRAFT_277651 [Mycena latifolia]|nr:hypothetical protein FB451DRAFT_277651 [Mycena latifolia]